jgi:Domain of unknown function (DUF3854)
MTSGYYREDGKATEPAELYGAHLEDLRRSGLSDSTIAIWGCFSIGTEDHHRLKNFAKRVKPPGLALPILPPGAHESVGFTYKPDNPSVVERGGRSRVCKYEMPLAGTNHIHVPRAAQWLFQEPDGRQARMRMVLTEGPKKAEKAVQERIPCVALLGVWNWLQKFGGESIPIEEISRIDWTRYRVEICFDSDAASNPHVRRAERALANWLAQHGAEVVIVRLPAGEDGSKVGLDDYLVERTAADFEALPRISAAVEPPLEDAVYGLGPEAGKEERNRVLGRILDEERDAAEQERLFKQAAKQTSISLKSLRASARDEVVKIQVNRRQAEASQPAQTPQQVEAAQEKARQQRRATAEAMLDEAENTVKLRAQSRAKGQLLYVAALDPAKILAISGTEVFPVAMLPQGWRLTEPPTDQSPMSKDGIRRFLNGEVVSGPALFDSLRDFFRRHAIYRHNCVASALALWSMGTYLHCLFNFYGYLYLTSLGPGCGKSLVEMLLSLTCFNATPPQTLPTPAAMFRDVEANSVTLILDEIESLDPEKKGDVLAALNAGFQRDATVTRMVPSGDGWKTQRFAIYSPKVIAGINHLPRTLHSRVFEVEMPKRKSGELVDLYQPDQLTARAARARDDQAIFALRNAAGIVEMYAAREQIVPRSVDDRLRDILGPLYAVAATIDADAGSLLATPELDRFAEMQAKSRQRDVGGGDYAIAARALWEWAADRWDSSGKVLIETAEAFRLFTNEGIDWVKDTAKTKSLLRKLGGENGPVWWKGTSQRGYVFWSKELLDVVERHPVPSPQLCCEEKR